MFVPALIKTLTSKFAMEIMTIGSLGVFGPYMLAADTAIKVLIGCVTLLLLMRKGYKDWNK